MEELISLANKLAGASFAVLLFVILAGSKFRIWRWQQDFIDLEKHHNEDLLRECKERERVEEDRDFWRRQALDVLGIAQTQASVLHVKETKETRRTDAAGA